MSITFLWLSSTNHGYALTRAGVSTVAPSNTERLAFLEIQVSVIEVTMKTAASEPVSRVKKLAPPELPKTVLLEPPNEALIDGRGTI